MTQDSIVTMETAYPIEEVKKSDACPMDNKFDADSGTRFQNIQEFLKTPRPVDTIVWAATDTALTLLAQYDVPDILFCSDMPVCKVADFRYFRCEAVFSFLVTAQRMSLGSVLAVIFPAPTIVGNIKNDTTLTQLTGYPHVLIDASSKSEVRLRVPYVARKMNYDMLLDTAAPWARIKLFVVNPLAGGSGSTSAFISVLTHCEQLHLSIRTPQHMTPFTPPVSL